MNNFENLMFADFLSTEVAHRVCQLNCVAFDCQELLGDNPECLFLGVAKVRIFSDSSKHLFRDLLNMEIVEE